MEGGGLFSLSFREKSHEIPELFTTQLGRQARRHDGASVLTVLDLRRCQHPAPPGDGVLNDNSLAVLMLKMAAHHKTIPCCDRSGKVALLDLTSGPDYGFDDDFQGQARTHSCQFRPEIHSLSGNDMALGAGQRISVVDL